MHLHNKTHGHLPNIKDAADPVTGKVDPAKLQAGAAAWQKALDNKEYEIVSATEVGIDDKHDVLTITRRKLK